MSGRTTGEQAGEGGQRALSASADARAKVDAAVVQGWIAERFAEWVQALNLTVESVNGTELVLRLPFDDRLARSGGMMCGQALMSAADTAMALVIGAHLGAMLPMTTVGL